MATPAPVDTSSFTPAQMTAFNAANALGTGVKTTGTPTTPAPVPTAAPTGQTSTNAAPATPTPVVGTGPATAAVGQMSNTAATAAAALAAHTAAKSAATTAPPTGAQVYNPQTGTWSTFVPPTPTPTTPQTPEQQIASQPDTGNQFIYDANGNQTQIPVGQPVPSGFSTTNPKTGPTATITDSAALPSGVSIKQFADGTYGQYDVSGNYAGTATAQEFTTAQQSQTALASYNQALNGSYPLTASQQAAIQGAKDAAAQATIIQQNINDNVNGAMAMLMNERGLSGDAVGISTIAQNASAGAQRITDIQNKLAETVATMTAADNQQNLTNLKDAFDEFSKQSDALNAQITKTHDDAVAAAKDARDFAAQQQAAITAHNDTLDGQIDSVILDAKKNGASPDVIAAMTKALQTHDFSAAVSAAGDSLNVMSGDFADYPQYKQDALTNGVAPLDPTAWLAKKNAADIKSKENEAYGTAFASAQGKAASDAIVAKTQDTTLVPVTSSGGITFNVPADVAPYVKISPSGVKYVDVSSLSAAEKGKIVVAAFNNGNNPIPVVTDVGNSNDIQNITDASLKLQDMKNTFDNITTDSAAARDSYYAAGITMATKLQTDPNAVASDIYQDAALDILKAMSGTKGFRGGTSMVEQVKSSFPQKTDTQAVVDTKIANMQKLIDDRQTGLIGNPSPSDQAIIDAVNVKNKSTSDLISSIPGVSTPTPQSTASFWTSILPTH